MWLEKRNGVHRICFREGGRIRRVKAYKDKQASKAKMADMERRQARGEQQLLNPFEEFERIPLIDQVEEWLGYLQQVGRAPSYIGPCRTRMMRLCRECGWDRISKIKPESFERWRVTALSEQGHTNRKKTAEQKVPLTNPAKNHYLDALRTFCGWLVKRGRMAVNPALRIEKLPATQDTSRQRRALTPEELVRLIKALPEEYRLLYKLTATTGLRRAELAALRWGDLHFDAGQPHVQLRASTTKSKRPDLLPLHKDLVEELKRARGDAENRDRVFKRVPRIKEHKRWLTAAGIPFADDQGRRLDFHSLRVTFCSLLSRSGAHPRVAMSLMRHTDIRLTMRIYTDPNVLNLGEAVDRLPSIPTGEENG